MLSGWRIAAPAFSTTPAEMLSGEGAYLYGGRWSSKGVRVGYLGTSLAQAAMELLVHLLRNDVLRGYRKLELSFPEELLAHIAVADLPPDWAAPSMASSVQAVGDEWVAQQGSVLLQVPSAAIAGEYNYLFNPAHPDAGAVRIGSITPFTFDQRVIKD